MAQDGWRRGRAPGARLRLAGLALVLVIPAAACGGSAGKLSASPTSATAASTSSTTAVATTTTTTVAAAMTTTTTVPAPTTTVPPSTTTTTQPTCAERAAADTFVFAVGATTTPAGGVALTAQPAKLVCGGYDDYHYDVTPTDESATVLPGASVEVMPEPGTGRLEAVAVARFPAYLAGDHGTRIFLLTGPLDAVTGLQEQFHP